jgi:hypothetical protein
MAMPTPAADLSGQRLGLVNGDTLSGALATSATTASNIGVYGINQGRWRPRQLRAEYTGNDLTVGQRALTRHGRRQEPRLWRMPIRR